MSQFIELEELEAFVATQDLLAFESENIRKDFIYEYLGDESDQRTKFEKPTTVSEIEQRERERIPLKTRQSTSWSANVYQAWADHTAIVKLKPYKMNIRLSLLIFKPPP